MPQGKRVWVRKEKFNFLSRVPRDRSHARRYFPKERKEK